MRGEQFTKGIILVVSALCERWVKISVFPQPRLRGHDKSLLGRLVSKKTGIAFAPLSVSLGLDQATHFPYEEGSVVYIPLKDDFWHKTIGIRVPCRAGDLTGSGSPP